MDIFILKTKTIRSDFNPVICFASIWDSHQLKIGYVILMNSLKKQANQPPLMTRQLVLLSPFFPSVFPFQFDPFILFGMVVFVVVLCFFSFFFLPFCLILMLLFDHMFSLPLSQAKMSFWGSKFW